MSLLCHFGFHSWVATGKQAACQRPRCSEVRLGTAACEVLGSHDWDQHTCTRCGVDICREGTHVGTACVCEKCGQKKRGTHNWVKESSEEEWSEKYGTFGGRRGDRYSDGDRGTYEVTWTEWMKCAACGEETRKEAKSYSRYYDAGG